MSGGVENGEWGRDRCCELFGWNIVLLFMTQTQVTLPDNLDSMLASFALEKGKKKEDIIVEAVEAYIHKTLTPEEILTKRRKAFGMWKDRTDLPDFDALRRSMDRKLNWGDDR
jgi:hypothetical protein